MQVLHSCPNISIFSGEDCEGLKLKLNSGLMSKLASIHFQNAQLLSPLHLYKLLETAPQSLERCEAVLFCQTTNLMTEDVTSHMNLYQFDDNEFCGSP